MVRKQKYEEPVIEPKKFADLAELERGIKKLGLRIADLQQLQQRQVRYDGSEADAVLSSVKHTILEVFGNTSPQWQRFEHTHLWDGPIYYGDVSESLMQQGFEKGVSHFIQLLQGEVSQLEEKKEDFPVNTNITYAPTIRTIENGKTLKSRDGTCFVICPIGPDESPIRKRSDDLLEHIIQPVMDEFNFKVDRADKLHDPGKITDQIIECLANADLVIADLTDNNASVFYELGVRHAIGKPVIQLLQKGEVLPFDVKVIRTIYYDFHIDQAKKSIEKLKETVIWLMNNPVDPLITHSHNNLVHSNI